MLDTPAAINTLPLRRRVLATLLRSATQSEGLPPLTPIVMFVRALRTAPRGEATEAIAALTNILREDDELRSAARAYTARLVSSIRASGALAESGVLAAHGFFAELRQRMLARILPSHCPPHELGQVLREVFDPADVRWLAEVGDEPLGQLLRLLAPDDELASATLFDATLRAIDRVTHRLAAAGDDPVLVGFDPDSIDFDSPFLAQAEHVLAVTAGHRERRGLPSAVGPGADGSDDEHARVLLSQCTEVVARIRRRAPKTGATIRMAYELERIDDLLARLVMLLDVLAAAPERAWAARAALLRRLALAQGESEMLAPLFRRGSQLVMSEIVARAGRTGEHYITRTRSEWGAMWVAAGGAGLIVACMAALKVGIGALHAPPLVEAALFSINYSLGFIVVQMLGLTIATKQPAMTAAALAGSIDAASPRDTRGLVETIQCLVRSQLAAILGNCVIALPAAYLVARGAALIFGAPIVDAAKAEHLVADLDPIASPALVYAAIAGVWLTVSGLVASYGASSVIARHVPVRMRRSERLATLFGPRAVEWLARVVETRTGAILGSIVLGTLLGTTGTFGDLVGLPIDVRHVSLSSATLGLSLATLGLAHVDILRTVVGIAGIGALNLGVSFSLALSMAMRAKGRSARDVPRLLGDLGRSAITQLPAWIVPVGPSAQASPESEP